MTLVVTVLVSVLVALSAEAQTVLDARPTVKVESGEGATSRSVLSESERTKYRVIITKRDGQYFWTSREERELVYRPSGAFHTFIDPRGGGYVKIFDADTLPASVRDPGPRFHYMEHLTLWLGTITYWGTADQFRLDDLDEKRGK